MSLGLSLLAIVVAYLLGAVSFSYLIVRMLLGIDIRTVGSGNAGATNVLRAAGGLPAAVALILDVGKGLAAVLVARALGVATPVVAGVGVAVVVGHMYPVFLGFRGGKGVATAGGTLASLAPLATATSALLFVAIVAWKRYVSLGSVAVAIVCPLLVLAMGLAGRASDPQWPWLFAGAAVIGALIVWKHRPNLARLMAGTESRLGQSSARGEEVDG